MQINREVKEIRDDQGRLLAQAEYRGGKLDGISRTWNSDSLLIEESNFREGKRHGRYTSWWDNGATKEEGTFYDGVKVGRHVWFSQKGSIVSEHDHGEVAKPT